MIKKMLVIFFMVMFVLAVQNSPAQTTVNMEVVEMMICTGVQDRVPVGTDTMFLKTVGQLYCYTKVTGAGESAKLSHVWYHNDQEMARVDLNIMADTWRTWSSKKIAEEWTGKWRVDVVSESGEVLKSISFTVQ
jgi:hypothetical protein